MSGTLIWNDGTDTQQMKNLLTTCHQRAQLLVDGPLSRSQRATAVDLLRDLETLSKNVGSSDAVHKAPEVFNFGELASQVVEGFRFVAHRKQLLIAVLGASTNTLCQADYDVVRSVLVGALEKACEATSSGSRVSVELCRSADRIALDISASGWDPHLLPAPPSWTRIALSVLRTASGARFVISVPAAE